MGILDYDREQQLAIRCAKHPEPGDVWKTSHDKAWCVVLGVSPSHVFACFDLDGPDHEWDLSSPSSMTRKDFYRKVRALVVSGYLVVHPLVGEWAVERWREDFFDEYKSMVPACP